MGTLTSRLALQDRKTKTKDGLCSIDIFCCYRTVSDEVELDHRLEVLGARMTHLGLEVASGLGLRDLLFTESFRLLGHGRHHR